MRHWTLKIELIICMYQSRWINLIYFGKKNISQKIFRNQTARPPCFLCQGQPKDCSRASMPKNLCASDISQRRVNIMLNCKKDMKGGLCKEVAFWTHRRPRAIVIPSPPFPRRPCFMARFCYCSLAHLAVWNEQVPTTLLTPPPGLQTRERCQEQCFCLSLNMWKMICWLCHSEYDCNVCHTVWEHVCVWTWVYLCFSIEISSLVRGSSSVEIYNIKYCSNNHFSPFFLLVSLFLSLICFSGGWGACSRLQQV